uniref:Uncharacterized protein n=1 Tax=viral metagenome TaxID=1070528 RepID=A0A6C0HGN6_9ZZZZ
MFKDEGDQFVDFCEKCIRSIKISDKGTCMLLRSLHCIMPVITVVIMIIGSKTWFQIILFFNILVFILFLLFHGCILSKIEHRFTDDEFTIIDPFLEMLGVELTNDNRHRYSFYSSINGFMVTFGLYYYRFGMPNFNGIAQFNGIE